MNKKNKIDALTLFHNTGLKKVFVMHLLNPPRNQRNDGSLFPMNYFFLPHRSVMFKFSVS